MSEMTFKRATKAQARARIALIGPAGSGKTYSALAIAGGLGDRVAVIDTEHGSASKYSDRFQFDTLELTSFSPLTYVEAIHSAEAAGYDVLVIDSLSHAWAGKDGALEQVDRAAKRSQSGNTFGAWREVTPQHNALVEAMLACRCHLIVTMRSKTDYVQERDERTGKTVVRKIGLAPVQRDGVEYLFDIAADMDGEHNLIVSKTRCPALDGAVISRPGAEFAATVRAWLMDDTAPAASGPTQSTSPLPSPAPVPTPPPAPPPPRSTPVPPRSPGHGHGDGHDIGASNGGNGGGAYRQGIEALVARYAAVPDLAALDELDAHAATLPRPIREAPQVKAAARHTREHLAKAAGPVPVPAPEPAADLQDVAA